MNARSTGPPAASGGWRESAVIDVGSNSVRLVVYRVDGRALLPVLNEKVTASLGRDLARTGALWPEGAATALMTIRRFAAIVRDLGVSDVHAVATAAVREASDGADFVRRVEAEAGLQLRVLSVEDEARLSALGVAAGAPEADGVVGDLGGFSLELIQISAGGGLGRGESFALGPLALSADQEFDYDRVAKLADAALAGSATLRGAGGAFYAVGGAWRAIGRIDIQLSNHPLGVLHHHEMSRAEVLKVVELTRRQSRRSLEQFGGAPGSRAGALPFAAVVLERVMKAGGFDRIVLSALGLREGVLLERMDPAVLAMDPLLAAADAIGEQDARGRALGEALAAWIEPAAALLPAVFSPARDRVLRGAAARLVELGGALHPDQRDRIMFDLVLRAPLTAISHEERAFLAAAMHHRYTKSPPKNSEAYERLLAEDSKRAAAALGALLRLGATASGRSERLIGAFELLVERGALVLKVKAGQGFLVNEPILRRLDAAAVMLDLAPELRPG
jgi:exopolyphosphatase / guanosine-5'-triphosphate,3'-diphosphate pyrophosphatase